MARGTKRSASQVKPLEEPSGDADVTVTIEHCEDENHKNLNNHKSGQEQGLCRRRDGIVRCTRCHDAHKRKLLAVGSRGLDLAAHFRLRRSIPSVEVIPSSPEADDEREVYESKATAQMPIEVSNCWTPKPAKSAPAAPLDDGVESTDVPPSEISDAAPKVLHIGCDVCPRWYVVDQVLFDHWREEKFTCCMIGERCGRKETRTTLVSCGGVPGMVTRMGRPHIMRQSRPRILPLGFWDIWRPGTTLCTIAPQVFAAPIATAGRERLVQAQNLLNTAFDEEEAPSKTIAFLLGLRRRRSRGAKVQAPKVWLLWQESESDPGHMVGAAILSWQRYTTVGPRELQGGVVLEYIARLPGHGAKAYYLIQAAEEVALLLGHTEIFSACDLNQDGRAFDGRALPALVAHQNWGFKDTDQKEWRDRRLEFYDPDCNVHFMVKRVGQ
ncbi:unnamed protein product [Symbiodinium pilosum]|uniref:Uncharacterized protein n=1 Tax=Symbiodinium pilosum TaxID=2952 RepID=A0A812X5T0_SYMPI|nr:unnamed protein product [Symbiodinium pilosum]